MNNNSFGYVYVAAGNKYIQEATVSAESLKRLNKDANITLIADKEVRNNIFNRVMFFPTDPTKSLEGKVFKVRHLYKESPYQKTLFVDTDTYFCDDCQEIFDLLDFFDIAMAPAPVERNKVHIAGKSVGACSTLNTGVIAYTKNSKNKLLFEKWLNRYQEKIITGTLGQEGDQTSFMEAWLESDSKIHVLSNEWNTRIPFLATLNEPVRIIHGRYKKCQPEDYEKLKLKINKITKHRCWNPATNQCIPWEKSWKYRVKHRLNVFFNQV